MYVHVVLAVKFLLQAAMLASICCHYVSVQLSVCLSARLPQAGIVSKRLGVNAWCNFVLDAGGSVAGNVADAEHQLLRHEPAGVNEKPASSRQRRRSRLHTLRVRHRAACIGGVHN